MPQRVTSSDRDGRLDILLSLRIGGGACPAGGVGDFTTCLLLGACTLHCFLIRTSALDAHDLFIQNLNMNLRKYCQASCHDSWMLCKKPLKKFVVLRFIPTVVILRDLTLI